MTDEIPKPKYAEPCNGCGLCCKLEICHVGIKALEAMLDFEAQAPCPFLVSLDGKYRCMIVLAEAEHLTSLASKTPLIAQSLRIGWGCTMPDEEEESAA